MFPFSFLYSEGFDEKYVRSNLKLKENLQDAIQHCQASLRQIINLNHSLEGYGTEMNAFSKKPSEERVSKNLNIISEKQKSNITIVNQKIDLKDV